MRRLPVCAVKLTLGSTPAGGNPRTRTCMLAQGYADYLIQKRTSGDGALTLFLFAPVD